MLGDLLGATWVRADDGLGVTGNELWRTDGTTAGTALFADLTPGPDRTVIAAVANVGATLYFGGNQSLWQSDLTVAGTAALRPFDHRPLTLTALGDKLLFVAYTAPSWDLWRTDGTVAGTELVYDFAELNPRTFDFVRPGDRVYFQAENSADDN